MMRMNNSRWLATVIFFDGEIQIFNAQIHLQMVQHCNTIINATIRQDAQALAIE